ncbi:MAG: hypothetical protein QNK92_10470 [Amylibacter sp.]
MKNLSFALLTALLIPITASADDQLDRIKTNWQAWAKANKATKSTSSPSPFSQAKVLLKTATQTHTPAHSPRQKSHHKTPKLATAGSPSHSATTQPHPSKKQHRKTPKVSKHRKPDAQQNRNRQA